MLQPSCAPAPFFLILYSFYTEVMLIFILIDVQYLQKVVFIFERIRMANVIPPELFQVSQVSKNSPHLPPSPNKISRLPPLEEEGFYPSLNKQYLGNPVFRYLTSHFNYHSRKIS